MKKLLLNKEKRFNKKSLVLFLLFLAISIVSIIVVAVIQKNKLIREENDIREAYVQKSELLANLNLAIYQAESLISSYLLTGNKKFVTEIKKSEEAINKATLQLLLPDSKNKKVTTLLFILDSLVKHKVVFLNQVVVMADADKQNRNQGNRHPDSNSEHY